MCFIIVSRNKKPFSISFLYSSGLKIVFIFIFNYYFDIDIIYFFIISVSIIKFYKKIKITKKTILANI